MPRWLAAALAAFSLLVLGSCGGDGNGEQQAARTVIEEAAQEQAASIVLTLDDFPAGWRAQRSDDEEDEPECVDFDFSDLTVNGRAESPDFMRGETTTVSSLAAIFKSEQEATSAYERLASQDLADCFVEFFKEQSDEDVRVTEAKAGELSFPDYGDQSSAWQFVINLEPQGTGLELEVSAYLDLVFVQQGRVLAVVLFVDALTPFPDDEKEDFVSTVADRVDAAPASG